MGTGIRRPVAGEESGTQQFILDSHHLAILDRFVAQARRRARHRGREFTGIVVEIQADGPISVRAAELDSPGL